MKSVLVVGLLIVGITTACAAQAQPTPTPDPTSTAVPPTSTALPTATAVPPSPTPEPTATPTPTPTATPTPLPPMRQYTQSVEGGIAWLDDRGAPNAVPKVPGTVLKPDKTSDGEVARYYFAADAPKLYGQDAQQFPIRFGELAGEYYPNVFLYTGTYTTPVAMRVGMLSLDPAIVKAQYLELAARRKPVDKSELTLALPWQLENPNAGMNVYPTVGMNGFVGYGFTFPARTKVIAPFFPDLPSREMGFFWAPDKTDIGSSVTIQKPEIRDLQIAIGFDNEIFRAFERSIETFRVEIEFGKQQRTQTGITWEAGASSFRYGSYLLDMIGNVSRNVQGAVNVSTYEVQKGQTARTQRSVSFELMRIDTALVAVRARK